MAYDADKHGHFSRRMQHWFKTFQVLRDELTKLDEIYTNETSSGSDAAFVTTGIATKQEHIDGIVFMRALDDFNDGSAAVSQTDRRSNITAFVQDE